jgi:hypothetical protein
MRPAREARFAGALVGGANVGKRLNSPDGSDSTRFSSHIYPSAQPSALIGAQGSAAGSSARAGLAGLRRVHIAQVTFGGFSSIFPT